MLQYLSEINEGLIYLCSKSFRPRYRHITKRMLCMMINIIDITMTELLVYE